MKKLYTALASVAAIAVTAVAVPEANSDPAAVPAEAKTVPYESALGGSSLDADWTVVNSNNDNKTWEAYSYDQSAKYGYSGSNAADDWFISPAIALEGGKEYIITYVTKMGSSSYKENLKFFCTPSADPELIKQTTPLKEYTDSYINSYTTESVSFTPETSGNYYFSFYACSIADRMGIYLKNFSIMENKFEPRTVTGLTGVRDASRAVRVDLSWTLPTKTTLGLDLTAEQTVEKVLIYRDGGERAIAELDGPVTTFTDTEDYGLAAGNHTYEVAVTVAGVQSARCAPVTVKNVGPLQPVPVPADLQIADEDDFDNWTVLKGEAAVGNTYDWEYQSSTARYRYVSSTDQDDWLISPPVIVSEPGYYMLTLGIYKSSGYDIANRVELYYGESSTIEAMTNLVSEKLPLSDVVKTQTIVTRIEKAGTYNFGIHAALKEVTGTMYVSVAGLKIEKTEKTPDAVTELTAIPDANFGLKVALTWTNPTLATTGDELTADEYKIEVYRGEELIATLDGGTSSYEDTVEKSGVYTYTVKTVAPEGASVKTHPSATTTWVGKPMVDLPYSTKFRTDDATIGTWSVIDANADGKTWYLYGSYSTATDREYMCNPPVADEGVRHYKDYLVSPYFAFEPGYYELAFTMRATKDMPLNVGLIPAGTASAERMDLTQVQALKSTGTSLQNQSLVFTIEEAGEYQIVFAMDMDTEIGTYYESDAMRIDDVKVSTFTILPGLATEIKATAGENEELTATVSWLNPADSNVPGVAPVLTKAVISRDGEAVAEVTEGLVAGEASSWTDSEETGLTAGIHLYKVEIYNENGTSEDWPTSVESEWIGGGLATPYKATGTNYGGPNWFAEWTIINVDGDKTSSSSWADESTWFARSSSLQANVTGAMSESGLPDDWAISDRIDIKKDALYKLTIETYLGLSYEQYDTGEGYPIDLCYGKGADPADFTKLKTLILTKAGSSTGNTETHEVYVYGADLAAAISETEGDGGEATDPTEPAEPAKPGYVNVPAGALNFAFHVTTIGGCNIFSFSVEKVAMTPGTASDLTAAVADDEATGATLSWTNPAAVDAPVEGLTPALTARIYRDGEIVEEISGLEAGAATSWTDSEEAGLAPGYHSYKVEIACGGETSEEAAPEVATAWIGAPLDAVDCGFDSWHTAAGWTLAEDGAMSASLAEGDAAAWALSPVVALDDDILYKVTVETALPEGSEGATLGLYYGLGLDYSTYTKVADIVATPTEDGQPSMTELSFYKKLPGTGEGEPSAMNDLPAVTVDDATALPVEKTAFALCAEAPAAATVKTFSVISAGQITGVDFATVGSGVVFTDGCLVFEGTATGICVYDLTGKLVAMAEAAEGSLPLENLQSGVYIVKMTLNGENITLKLRK